jgi:o-succinylbenzoate synthase
VTAVDTARAAAELERLAVDGLSAARGFRLVRVRVPLRRRHRTAHGTEEVREVLILGVGDDAGTWGWGECPTLSGSGYSTETTDVAWEVAVTRLLPEAVASASRPDGDVPALGDAPMLSSALHAALTDLALRRDGATLAEVLGVAGATVARGVVLGDVEHADDARRQVHAAFEGGATLVKLKVTPDTDPDVVAAAVAAAPAGGVAIDANGSLGGAPHLLGVLDSLGLAYLEQPWSSVDGATSLPAPPVRPPVTPVVVDEGAPTTEASVAAVCSGTASIVNVKPARLGGLAVALRCVAAVREVGGEVFVGGMLETGVGRAGAVALAAHVAATHPGPGPALPTDLGPSSQYFTADLTEDVVLDDSGRLVVPGGPGIGVEPDDGRLEAASVGERFWEVP